MSEWLNHAAQEGNLELVLQALENGDDPEEEDEDGVTALMIAAEQGHLEVMKALLTLGADANSADANGVTVLMRAALKGHIEAVCLLIAEGTCALAVDNDGATALHYAALGGDLNATGEWFSKSSVIYHLAWASADRSSECLEVEPVDSAGWTPLMIAAAAGHTNAVRTLLRHGARPGFSAGYGKTPLSLAIEGGHEEVVQVLQKEAARSHNLL